MTTKENLIDAILFYGIDNTQGISSLELEKYLIVNYEDKQSRIIFLNEIISLLKSDIEKDIERQKDYVIATAYLPENENNIPEPEMWIEKQLNKKVLKHYTIEKIESIIDEIEKQLKSETLKENVKQIIDNETKIILAEYEMMS
ncbi:hypothetical protein ACFLSQ_02025 [Bacteroidota bacterium]